VGRISRQFGVQGPQLGTLVEEGRWGVKGKFRGEKPNQRGKVEADELMQEYEIPVL